YELTEAPASGTVTLDDSLGGRFVYSPRAGFVGTDRFSYTARAADGTLAAGTVHVEVAENCRSTPGQGYQLLECLHSVLDPLSFNAAWWQHPTMILPTLYHGPLVLNDRPDYVGYYEYSTVEADKGALAP